MNKDNKDRQLGFRTSTNQNEFYRLFKTAKNI